ncbi:hypothetical protein QX249_11670 [Vibrio parahaemolyticus]|uniref:Uncharacterized protein n=1 Tax=Vibrio parahaemolyticus TaxID=670 RepID=A0AAW8Q155_VIBPH|nr:hypothetical protein [Vibrio parahaemolyticus]EGR2227274.1 hypothetical protein [Vibrio parahaemolyticus]MDS1821324.1 hypothetical protein [Vibrio parahaemolyticus]
MKLNLNKYNHLTAWFMANALSLLVFTLYATFLTDYSLTHLSEKAAIIVGGLSLYQFCAIMWLTAFYERADHRLVYVSAIFALVTWHFSFWGEFSMFTTELAGGIDGDPSFRVFDKQSTIMYLYLFGWAYVCGKALTKKFHDLQFMALSGGVLLAILVGYHLLGFWSVYDQADRYTKIQDQTYMAELIKLPDSEFPSVCEKLEGVECFRFNALIDGYPDELLNYNAAYRNSIVSLANDPMTQSETFGHTYLHRDTLFEDNYSEYYSRSFFFDQRKGVVHYVISNYFGDVPVNYLTLVCWMLIIAGVFWNWLVVGIGIEHSRKLENRKRKSFDKKEALISFAMIMLTGPYLAWAGMDYFFGEYTNLLYAIILGMGFALVIKKQWSAVIFLLSCGIFITPAIYTYVLAQVKVWDILDIPTIEEYSLKGLMYTSVAIAVGLIAFKKMIGFKKEVAFACGLLAIGGVLITYVGTHMIFPSLLADSEAIRIDYLFNSGKPFIEFCKTYNFDICQTVNNPEWKWEFYKPMMNSVWYMLVAGVLSMTASLLLLTSYAHRKK